jgi:glyoxylase-like metal-dependent hydrolase (beta-lactamase superfamily II)
VNTRADPNRADSNESYEVYTLRFASRHGSKAKEFYGYQWYGEPDEPCSLDYLFWLVRNHHRTILVDCGYSREAAHTRYRHNHPNNDPLEVLALMDVAPSDVDHVVVSHMHYDHCGNLRQFPNATFSIARKEYEFCTGPYGDRRAAAGPVDPSAVITLQELVQDGRVRLIDDSEVLFPGLRVTRLGAHTPGHMMTEITVSSGHVVLASDAIHFYEEMTSDRPFWFFFDLIGMYRNYEILRQLAAQPGTSVVPGHDPEIMRRFKVVHEGYVVDLTAPCSFYEDIIRSHA